MAIKLDNTKQVESRLPIEPLINKETLKLEHDGIPFVKITNVSVITHKHEKGEYKGLDVPSLEIEVLNHKLHKDDEDRFLIIREKTIHSRKLVEGSEDEYTNMDPKIVSDLTESMYYRIKHIHDAFAFSPFFMDFNKMTPKEVNEYFNLPDVADNKSPEERVEAFTKFFNFIADRFNGLHSGKDGQPIYKDGNSYHIMRLKVVAEYSSGNYFTIPTYVGQGFIEKAVKKDGKWMSPRRVSKRPKDVFTLTESKSKSSLLKSLEPTDEDTNKLLEGMDI